MDMSFSPTPSAGSEASSVLRRALVVDDNEDSAHAFASFLRMNQFEVEVAGDGTEALFKALKFQPDLVLLDIQMPKLDGFDTCRVIRAQPWGSKAFVVAVTGLPIEDVRERSTQVGFDSYLMKPVSCDAIQAIIEKRFT